MNTEETFKRFLAQTTNAPLTLEVSKAEAEFLYDTDGNEYIDFVAGLAVNNVGHRHPKILEALHEQLNAYLHIIPYGEFLQKPQIRLAKQLADLLPPHLSRSYFVNSGAEAVEGALKLAKRHTGRKKIIAFHQSYHGSTHGALSVSGNPIKQTAFTPLLPGIEFINYNQEKDLVDIDQDTAAVIIETIQGDAAVKIPSKPFLKALRRKCEETGAVLIFDEIQSGIGRTGKMFAFEHFGIYPDILCLAKALGGGMPIGCFIASNEMMLKLSHDPALGHITTFGGHPLSCAAASACLEIVENELLDQVEKKGKQIKNLLKHPYITEVRQIGLMIAVDLPSPELTDKIVRGAVNKGLILFRFLSSPSSFRVSPPLNISKSSIEKACRIITDLLDQFCGVKKP